MDPMGGEEPGFQSTGLQLAIWPAPCTGRQDQCGGEEYLALSCECGRKGVIAGDVFPKMSFLVYPAINVQLHERAVPAYRRNRFGLKY